ncbi:hypothetical protein RB594_007175 [Gaeumannomyces avenae]
MHNTPPPRNPGSSGTPDATPHIMMGPIYEEPPLIIGSHSATVEAPDFASRKPPPSEVITVLGDTRQLSQTNPPRCKGVAIGSADDPLGSPAASNSAANSLFAHTGGGLKDETLKELMDTFDRVCSENLQTSKWNAHADDPTYFISFSTLDTVVNRSLVERVIQRLPGCKDHAQTTSDIWSPVSLNPLPTDRRQHRVGLTTRRRLFLLVLLAQKPEKILDLIEEGVTDNDLPFVWALGSYAQRRRGSQESAGRRVNCLSTEKNTVRSVFTDWQWKTLSPFLWLSTREEPKVQHYRLDGRTPLPFIEASSPDLRLAPGSCGVIGGFSVVQKVAIEPSHFNHDSFAPRPGAEHPFFAVKTLHRHTKRGLFEGEVEALKRMMTEGELHRSLVRLLATIDRGDQYHMIFPWADGNLQEYWEKLYPEPNSLPRGRGLAKWMAWELLGLAQAIKRVHDSPVCAGNLQEVEQTGKVYGCHGDIKPHNILFFQGNDPSGDRGKLQLADFGLARFHSKESIRVSANSAGHTDTYRSPEFDMDSPPGCRVTVGPKTDIWSFGAVALEFVVWYCAGWKDLESFAEERAREDIVTWQPRIQQDKFFNRYHEGLGVKRGVLQKIESLRSHPLCSRYLRDLLDYIESHLLVVNEDRRACCRKACAKFADMFSKCEGDLGYCTERGPVAAPPSPWDNTSLARPHVRADDTDGVALAQTSAEASPRKFKALQKRKLTDDLEHDTALKIARQRTTEICRDEKEVTNTLR